MVCEARVVAIVFILVVVIPLLNFGHLRNLPRDFAHAGLIYLPKHLFPESVLLQEPERRRLYLP